MGKNWVLKRYVKRERENTEPRFIHFPATFITGHDIPSLLCHSFNGCLAFYHCDSMIIHFPSPLLMDIWVVSNVFAVTNNAVNICVHLCGKIFRRWILLMSAHDRFRMPHVECSRDVISALRRAQPGKRRLARVSLH